MILDILMNIYELTIMDKLNNAFYKTSKISHWKETTQRYKMNLLQNNMKLQEEIRSGTYKVSPTTNFTLYERGKIREIEAPAIRDRVIQKVLCEYILLPYIRPKLIYDNYASLKNRGTSFARKRIYIHLKRYIEKYGDNGYVLQIDIKKYFKNINHNILKRMLHDLIKESDDIMNLIDYIIDTSSKSDKGLNLGSEAPQLFAIYYLNKLDQYIKTVKGVKYYGRYMDDIIIIGNSKKELKILLEEICDVLEKLDLEINEKKTNIIKLSHGFTYMQIKYNIFNGKIITRPAHGKIVRERRRLKKFRKKYDEGKMSEYDIHNCYMSWRNSLIKDCNSSYKSIKYMDELYEELFPIHEEYKRSKRNEIENKSYLIFTEDEFNKMIDNVNSYIEYF